MFPTRPVVTRTANMLVIPTCADSESVYSDIMSAATDPAKRIPRYKTLTVKQDNCNEKTPSARPTPLDHLTPGTSSDLMAQVAT